MLFVRELRLPCDLFFDRPADSPALSEEYLRDLLARFEDVHSFARERISMATWRMQTRYDIKATSHEFQEGGKVWLWKPVRHKGFSPMLQSNWDGQHTVLKRLNDVVISIRKLSSSKPIVVHYDCGTN